MHNDANLIECHIPAEGETPLDRKSIALTFTLLCIVEKAFPLLFK